MPSAAHPADPTLAATLRALEAAGGELTLRTPAGEEIRIGARPERALARFGDAAALRALARRDPVALADAYLAARIELDGDLLALMPILDVVSMETTWRERLRFAWELAATGRRRLNRASIRFHYDRPPDFFLPWFERWRSYSHGFYATPEDPPEVAQERKLAHAFGALRLAPGMRVLDMGAGWGSFVEYAGRRGVRVHGITLSAEQHRFVSDLITRERLPCTIELVDFLDFRPAAPLEGAVFMGTFEHLPDYRRAAAILARVLAPRARVYADFCAQHRAFVPGRFIRERLWPGAVTYVDLGRLVSALTAQGFNVLELADDTLSYAFTVRDWADGLERARKELSARFGEADVRTFLLFLRASQHFLLRNRTQAYHLVAGREPAPLRPEG
jgi:cyclopropane-fatty-acyl-phospholipid synthase